MPSLVNKENMPEAADKAVLRETRTAYRKLGRTLENNKAEILRPGDKILAQVRLSSTSLTDR